MKYIDINEKFVYSFIKAENFEWEAQDPILGENTIALDINKHSIKIGDGVTKWSKLKNWGGSGVPIRTIVAWGGSTNEIPEGWALCDGRTLNGITTPNLVGKFIKAANASGGTGGKNSQSITLTTANMPRHTHTFTGDKHSHDVGSHTHTASGSTSSSEGAHTHQLGSGGNTLHVLIPGNATSCVLAHRIYEVAPGANAPCQNHDAFTMTSSGQHTHSFSAITINPATGSKTDPTTVSGTISTEGSGSPFTVQTVPEYYELCFIMKVSDQ